MITDTTDTIKFWENKSLVEKFDYAVGFWNKNNCFASKEILSFYYMRAVQENDNVLLNKLMDYCGIPNDMTFKERLAYYELVGNEE